MTLRARWCSDRSHLGHLDRVICGTYVGNENPMRGSKKLLKGGRRRAQWKSTLAPASVPERRGGSRWLDPVGARGKEPSAALWRVCKVSNRSWASRVEAVIRTSAFAAAARCRR